MCHGQILSTRVQRSRILRRCSECGGEILPGDERYVQVQSDGGIQNFECCLMCAAQMHSMPGTDWEGCSLWDRSGSKEAARSIGWQEFRKYVRAEMTKLRERFGRRRA